MKYLFRFHIEELLKNLRINKDLESLGQSKQYAESKERISRLTVWRINCNLWKGANSSASTGNAVFRRTSGVKSHMCSQNVLEFARFKKRKCDKSILNPKRLETFLVFIKTLMNATTANCIQTLFIALRHFSNS